MSNSQQPQKVSHPAISRRRALEVGGAVMAISLVGNWSSLAAAEPTTQSTSSPSTPPANKRFKVSVDDEFLMNGQRQTVKCFGAAKQCGLDGVVVDMGRMPEGKTLDNKLRDPAVRQQFLDASRQTGIAISTLSFEGMYGHNFGTMDMAMDITREWVDMLTKMNVRIGHMPLMGDSHNALHDPANAGNRAKVIEILKKVAPDAEKAGVIMGIESNFNGDDCKRFLDDVGSPAVKIAYNPGTGLENKYDVYQDIRDLGKDRICLLHLEQGSVKPEKFEHLLGDGLIDFKKLRQALLDIDWGGWLQIARSRKKGREKKPIENYTYNAKYLHDMFPE